MSNRPSYVTGPVLAGLSVEDLGCILDLYEGLADTAMAFANRPCFSDRVPSTVADRVWSDALAVYDEVLNQLRRVATAVPEDAVLRERILLKHLAFSDSLSALSRRAKEAAEAYEDPEACHDEVTPRHRAA